MVKDEMCIEEEEEATKRYKFFILVLGKSY